MFRFLCVSCCLGLGVFVLPCWLFIFCTGCECFGLLQIMTGRESENILSNGFHSDCVNLVCSFRAPPDKLRKWAGRAQHGYVRIWIRLLGQPKRQN